MFLLLLPLLLRLFDYSIMHAMQRCSEIFDLFFFSFFLMLFVAGKLKCESHITCVTSSAARRRVGGVRCLLHMQLFHQLWQSVTVTVSVQLVKHVQGARPGQARPKYRHTTKCTKQDEIPLPSPSSQGGVTRSTDS